MLTSLRNNPPRLEQMPQVCDLGVKRYSNRYQQSWTGYRLHTDTVGEVPRTLRVFGGNRQAGELPGCRKVPRDWK